MKNHRIKNAILPITLTAAIIMPYMFRSLHVSGSEKMIGSSTPVVKTIQAEKSSGEGQLEMSGFIRGAKRANVAPMTSGRILKIYKREGETVRKGEAVAQINVDQANAQVSAANDNVEALEKTLDEADDYYDQLVDQTKKTKDKEAIKSAKRARDLQKQIVENQIVAAEGSSGIAQVGKNYAILTAPFDGTITSMPVREGDFATIGVPLASIDSPNNFELETYVASRDGQKIFVGNAVQIQLADGKPPVSGTVIAVSPAVDTQNLKTLVRIRIDDKTGLVKLGDFVRGTIQISGQGEALIEIPRKAIISRGGDPVVFVVEKDNIAQERVIKLGQEQDGTVSIIQGLSEGDQVIVEGQHYLTNNIKVKLYGSE